jgi:hypothetical protein
MKSDDYGWTNKGYHVIDTGEARPTAQPPRLRVAQQADVGEMLEDMQPHGVMEVSDRPYSSVVVLVRKNGNLSFCIDFTKLNDVTKKKGFPLPRINDNLNKLAGVEWFSSGPEERYW